MTVNAGRYETQIAYHRRRAQEVKRVRQPWEAIWREIADYIEPTRLRLQTKDEGAMSRRMILNSTATLALRTLKSGMHSGITSPARPWFRLATFDPGMKDFGPAKTYLGAVEMRMREVFQSSNLYNAFHTSYGDLAQFGQPCGLLVEDDQSIIRMMQLVPGSFWIVRDETGRATTVYRTFRWSVQRIVARFGYDKCPHRIRTAYDTAKYDDVYDIWHAVEPRMSRNPDKSDKPNKPYLSNYWLDGGDEGDGLLEESGFDSNPIIAPPWELSGDDHYAISPGHIAVGDVKGLQLETKRKWEAIDRKVRPPMTGPTSMKNNPASTLPGSITYVDDPTGKGYRAAMEVNIDLSHLVADIKDVRDQIREIFYADLFLMLQNLDGIQPRTQFELAERKEEKLLALGPVLENIYGGQLEPVIDRTFAILNARGELPPPPPELRGKDLKIEYISILAQAQKAVATGAIERGAAFVGQMSAVNPEAIDKLDVDEAIDVYFDYIGMPPSIVVPDDKVAEMRANRAQEQQAAKSAEMAATVAPAVKQSAEAAAVLASAQDNPGAGALLQSLGIG